MDTWAGFSFFRWTRASSGKRGIARSDAAFVGRCRGLGLGQLLAHELRRLVKHAVFECVGALQAVRAAQAHAHEGCEGAFLEIRGYRPEAEISTQEIIR